MMIGGVNLDVRLLLDGVGRVSPGRTVTVPITFLSPDLAKPLCSVGAPFRLRELGVVAEGVIDQLLFE